MEYIDKVRAINEKLADDIVAGKDFLFGNRMNEFSLLANESSERSVRLRRTLPNTFTTQEQHDSFNLMILHMSEATECCVNAMLRFSNEMRSLVDGMRTITPETAKFVAQQVEATRIAERAYYDELKNYKDLCDASSLLSAEP